jgi:hypothetical protein
MRIVYELTWAVDYITKYEKEQKVETGGGRTEKERERERERK